MRHKVGDIYKEIWANFTLLDEIEREMEIIGGLNGHKHFMIDKIEDKILDLIERDDRVLGIIDGNDRTIAMLACIYKLEKVPTTPWSLLPRGECC